MGRIPELTEIMTTVELYDHNYDPIITTFLRMFNLAILDARSENGKAESAQRWLLSQEGLSLAADIFGIRGAEVLKRWGMAGFPGPDEARKIKDEILCGG